MFNTKLRIFVFYFFAFFSFQVPVYSDNNPVYSPCGNAPPIRKGDGFSIGFAFGGDSYSWLEASPCDPVSISNLSSLVQVAVFRAKVDELTLIRINNVSMQKISEFFPNSSMIVYAGTNPAIVSEPRQFLSPDGRVPTFTLVAEFNKGKLKKLTWKDSKCDGRSPCASSSPLCFDGLNCATPLSECINSNSTSQICRLAVNIAFSGTDKLGTSMTSWYQVSELNKYSLTRLYDNAKGSFVDSLGISTDQTDVLTRG